MVLGLLAALVLLGTGFSPSTALAAGYWQFEGIDLSPKQSVLDETARGMREMGRVFDARVSGGFQAAGGRGSVQLFFKVDDVDRHVFTTEGTYTFGAGRDMSVLVPGEKITMEGALSITSNLPGATGAGTMWVQNGDNFIEFSTPAGQQASNRGSFTVSAGGDTMWISATGGVSSLGSLNETVTIYYKWIEGPVPPQSDEGIAPPDSGNQGATSNEPVDQGNRVPGGDILGPQIQITEILGWSGTWTRRQGTDVFDATWQNVNGSTATDIIRITQVNGRNVTLSRDGNGGTYFGTVSADGETIAGTASWYPADTTWSGVIVADGDDDASAGLDLSGPIMITPDSTFGDPDDQSTPTDEPASGPEGDDEGPTHWDTTPVPSQSGMFADNWNPAICDLTNLATLVVKRAVHLDRFDLWIKWHASERTMPYTVTNDGVDIGGGTLRRDACDPIQGAWCVGTDRPDADLVPGTYEIQIDQEAICQNAESEQEGFIRAWGH
jgi:hypothetical protein